MNENDSSAKKGYISDDVIKNLLSREGITEVKTISDLWLLAKIVNNIEDNTIVESCNQLIEYP